MTGPSERPYGIAPAGYRLPETTRIGRVTLQVSDLSRSLAFYEQVLGMRVLERTAHAASLGPQANDDRVLIELHEQPGARAVPRRGLLGLYHFALLLPDRASLGRFLAHLTEIGARAGMADHLVSEAIYLQDPDNLGIEIYADRPRSEWRHEGRQIAMTTDPLDVRDLLRAAGDARWQGLPPGTTVGHVHLHVGDLEEAKAFYHQALGFDQVVWSYPGALFLSAGGYHHHLGTNTWAMPSPAASDKDARLIDWELVLPSAEEAKLVAESLRAAGREVSPAAGGHAVRDPWGTSLRITAEPAK